jgi:hypothetical protein
MKNKLEMNLKLLSLDNAQHLNNALGEKKMSCSYIAHLVAYYVM